jgi:glyoxylate reductase
VKYAASKNIVVTNTPDVLTDATAEITISLMLACSRRIVEGDKVVRQGKYTGWRPDFHLGIELKGKTLGIAGAGRIGRAAAVLAKALGMNIMYYNRSTKEDFEKMTGAVQVSLERLLSESDVISLHLPLNKETFHLLNKDNLDKLKPDAILVNTARGELVDEKYLIKILREKKIFSAGLDVYENEPEVNREFFALDNVVLLPHIGSATLETRNNMAALAAKNIVEILKNGKAITPVTGN